MDSGGLLFKRPALTSGQAEQEKATAAAIAEAYRLMGYDAVGVSAHDLAAGVDFLKKTGRQARLPLLSANLLNAATHKAIFTPAITRKVGRITVGIIGITDPAAMQPPPADTLILPWQQVLPELTSRLQRECDLIILLSSLPAEENRHIAETVAAIRIIFQSGGEGATNLMPRQHGNTLITQADKQGKYLGALQIAWRQSGKWGIDRTEQLLAARRQLDQVDWQLKRLQRKGNPKTGFGGNTTLTELYRRLAASRSQLVADMALLAKPGQETDSTYHATFAAMETSLPEEPKVRAVLEKAKEETSRIGRQKAQRTQKGGGTQSPYLGWSKCAGCHAAQTSAWRKSRHADSLRSLVKRKQQFNLDCLPCHVTGVTAADPAEALALSDERRQVGCESCHGPGRGHAADPANNRLAAKPAASVCLACHTPDQDNDFNYQRDRRLVH